MTNGSLVFFWSMGKIDLVLAAKPTSSGVTPGESWKRRRKVQPGL